MKINSSDYFRGILDNPKEFDQLVLFKNVNDMLDDCEKKYSSKACIQFLNGSKTYSDLKSDAMIIAKVLKESGVSKGDTVGLLFRNEYDFVISFFACSMLGAIAALLPLSLQAPVVERLSYLFRYKVILFNDFGEPQFESINSLTKINVSKLDYSCGVEVEKASVLPDDPACIVFTGGTTGNPKGVLLSHKNLCRGALNGTYTIGTLFNHRYLSLIPFTHIFGLIKNLLSSILSGSTLYVCPNPASFAKEAMAFAPDTLVLTPGLASMVLTLMKTYSPKMFGPNFNTIIAGGANVPPKLIEEFYELGIKCLPGYGLTEAANLVSGNASIEKNKESVGIMYPGQELKIVDNELLVKGDNVFLGYYGNPEATNKVLIDGWLHTGDLATMDEDGFLYIYGRVGNMIVLSSGLKIVPEEIEAEISLNKLVRDSIVRKALNNDSIEAEVLLFDNSEANQEIVKEYILNEVNSKINGDIKVTNVIFRSEDFKRTPAMKIIR